MRGSQLQGRFNIDYEAKAMYEGIGEDLGAPVGVEVSWWRWQDYYVDENYQTVVDDIYDVGARPESQGRRWMLPVQFPVVMAQLIRSTNVMNERGFYVTDTLRLVINVGDAERFFPSLLTNPSQHIKDRIVYRGEVFVPTRVLPRGHFGYRYSVLTIDCNQVNSEELVNDPQFQKYAAPVLPERRDGVVGLKSILINGEPLTGFATGTTTYNNIYYLPTDPKVTITPTSIDGTNSVITIGADTVESGATYSRTIGSETSFTVTVVNTAADGETTKTYTLNFVED